MFKFHQDQAEGLRRIMANAKPRVLSILSASANHNQSRLMTNLAASINAYGSDVLVVHASDNSQETAYAVEQLPALLDVAYGHTLLVNAIKVSDQGFAVAKLTHQNQTDLQLDTYETQQLGFIFEELTHEFDIVLVDAALDQQSMLPLPILNESEILIQLSRQPDSIKQAYSLIKRVCSQLGRRSFCIVVDDATEAQAMTIFNNIAAVAWRYMKIQLTFFGAIPSDVHLNRAARLGRSVVDAFPMATASTAFQKIAQRLDNGSQHDNQLEHAPII
jgi:flagellar biosynthesis protein FlhG